MRLIRKGSEPGLLLAHRKTPGASYENLSADALKELRAALVREQGGLCAYCMGRVAAETKPALKMKIAHHLPRTIDRLQALSWKNLFAVCTGNEGTPPKDQHCDTRQGDTVLQIFPGNAEHIASLSYAGSGEVRTGRDDLRHDIETTLNLNQVSLRNRRKEALRAALGSMAQLSSGGFSKALLEKALVRCTTPDARGFLPPFVGTIEWWIRRRLRQAS